MIRFLAFLVALCVAAPAQSAPPAYSAKIDADYNAVASADRSTFDLTGTCTAGRAYVVSGGHRHNVAATNWASVVFDPGGGNETNFTLPTDGVDTARVDHEVAAGVYWHHEIWVLVSAPASGACTIRVTYGGTIVGGDGATLHEYTGVDSTGDVATNFSLGSTTPSCTATTTRDDSTVIGGVSMRGSDTAPFTPGTDDTEREDVTSGVSTTNDIARYDADESAAAATTAVTIGATASADDDWDAVCVELKSAAVSTGGGLMLLGVGN